MANERAGEITGDEDGNLEFIVDLFGTIMRMLINGRVEFRKEIQVLGNMLMLYQGQGGLLGQTRDKDGKLRNRWSLGNYDETDTSRFWNEVEGTGAVMKEGGALELFGRPYFSYLQQVSDGMVGGIGYRVNGGLYEPLALTPKQLATMILPQLNGQDLFDVIAPFIPEAVNEVAGRPPFIESIQVSRASTGQTSLWAVSNLPAERVKMKLVRVDGAPMSWVGDDEPLPPGAVGPGSSGVWMPVSNLWTENKPNLRRPLNPSATTTGIPSNTPIWVYIRDENAKTTVYKFKVVIPSAVDGIQVLPVDGNSGEGPGPSKPYANKPIAAMSFQVGTPKSTVVPADTVISSLAVTVSVDASTPLPTGVTFDASVGTYGAFTGNISQPFPTTPITLNFTNSAGTTAVSFYMQGFGGDVIEWIDVAWAGGGSKVAYLFTRIKTTTNLNAPHMRFLFRGLGGDSYDYNTDYFVTEAVANNALPLNTLNHANILEYTGYPAQYYVPQGAGWFMGFRDALQNQTHTPQLPATIWVKRGDEIIQFDIPSRVGMSNQKDFVRYYPVYTEYVNHYNSLGGNAEGNTDQSSPVLVPEVGGPNNAPVRQSQTVFLTAYTGVATPFDFPADRFSDSDGDSLTWGVEFSPFGDGNYGPLPAWSSFNASTRRWMVTPPSEGTYYFRLKVDDGRGGVAYDPFPLSVSNQLSS
ncbi:hypothetical protein [Tellurirhabdus bombi]|uniref:hypothetical protein n=1 Tax=Tellurirhabdus bombi TaxID=2907205 RepID=UPI001F2DA2A3|nr:hypothetical protein [Tellurirhabdus bombi]